MTSYGIRLTGTARDLASLRVLTEGPIELLDAPWTELSESQGHSARGHSQRDNSPRVVFCDAIDLGVAQGLRTRNVDMVRATKLSRGWTLNPMRQGSPGENTASETWHEATERLCNGLIEALRPLRLSGDPLVDEACFWVPCTGHGAERTLERLLALGRDDVSVSEIMEGALRVLILQCHNPPLYLLMRAREEASEGVRAYARQGDGGLWVEWGYAHPLGAAASGALKATERRAYVDARGAWRYGPAALPARSIYDALIPSFEARRMSLSPAEGASKFTVRLRMGAGPSTEAELWILDAAQLMSMEPLLDSLSTDEVSRFTIARTTGPARGTAYVLQELVRPNVPRLSTRVSDLVGARGYARCPGTDNLYLPLGRRLFPVMRREELRGLLQLDQSRVVVIEEDRDGPRVVSVGAMDEVPLSRWVEYVATDRREELERLAEESIFAFPELRIEKALRVREKNPKGSEGEPEGPRPPRIVTRERAPASAYDDDIPVEVDELPEDQAALREEIRGLERVVAEGGCDDEDTWRSLGALKLRMNDADEACACMEAALFHAGKNRDVLQASLMASLRERQAGAKGSPEELVDLAVRERLSPAEASYLGARVVEKALRGDSDGMTEAIYQQAARVFSEEETPVSRRLAWLVLSSLYRRTHDALGVTRAKEKTLGAINDRGLVESYDMPRFIRYALALEGSEEAGAVPGRGRDDQLVVLEQLWQKASGLYVRELDSKSAYVRLIFAVGFTRLGAAVRARDLTQPLEVELSVHEVPNRHLFGLYQARLTHVATQGDQAAWLREVTAALNGIKDARVRDRVEWLRKRSEWLRSAPPEESPPGLRAALARSLNDAEQSPERLAATLAQTLDQRDLYDYEVTVAVSRMLRAALRSGNDDALSETLSVAMGKIPSRIGILGHRARAIGECIRAAAALGDLGAIDKLLDEVVSLAGAPEVPSVRDLLSAVNPGLAALRRLGIGGSARRFLDALGPMASRGGREGVKLRAALSDGYLQLRDTARAEELMEQAMDETVQGSLDHVGRYEAGVAVLSALKHWPMVGRTPRALRLIENLDRFTDTFTASLTNLYATHKVLILERVVDSIVDDVTFQSDKVQAYLDAEEQGIRRRIIGDWRDVCGH